MQFLLNLCKTFFWQSSNYHFLLINLSKILWMYSYIVNNLVPCFNLVILNLLHKYANRIKKSGTMLKKIQKVNNFVWIKDRQENHKNSVFLLDQSSLFNQRKMKNQSYIDQQMVNTCKKPLPIVIRYKITYFYLTFPFRIHQNSLFKFRLFRLCYNQFLRTYLMLSEPKCCSIEEVKTLWNGIAPVYNNFDPTFQTFYYTLINMMKIPEAKHIYEVGCGTGKLIPYTLSLKPSGCTYLATDISEKMVEFARSYLSNYTHKLGVTESIDKWLERQRLEIGVLDGETTFKPIHRFDRIIANLVLNSTSNPQKMLNSLHEVAEEGCLLGVTIWGDRKLNNFMNLPTEARISQGKPVTTTRDNFHLYNKLEQIGSESGWELLVQWQQNSPFNSLEYESELPKILKETSEIDSTITSFVEKRVKETFSNRRVLNFSVQMAIFRRK